MQRGLNQRSSVLDLGDIRRPLLVFGGPYSNIQATEAILKLARDRGFEPEQIICTGDIVAYCANPVETVRAIREAGIHVVMGNCEESLGLDLEDCGCGFDEDSACDIASKQWFEFSSKRLSIDDKTWMAGLPRHITATINQHRLSFIHGSATSISGWIFASTPDEEKSRQMDLMDADIVVAGHCGLPFISSLQDNRKWVNAGVIGMAANDGTNRGWFATIWPQNDQICIKIEPFVYDSAKSAEAMDQAGLLSPYTKSLSSGLWPNMDVLPEAERTLRGIEIKPEIVS